MRFLMVGGGFRGPIFRQVAAGIDGLECVGVVHRTPRADSVPVYPDVATAISAQRPDFVVCSTPWDITEATIRACVAAGLPILAETPPAADPDAVYRLAADVGHSPLVHIAEQYPRFPEHSARIAVIGRGLIGEVGQVQVSATQTYHAVALMRAMLGLRAADTPTVTVRAHQTWAPLVQPLDRGGWTDDAEPHLAGTILGVIDFAPNKSGVYDLTDGQTRNLLRTRRLVARGSLGEINGLDVVRLAGPRLITTEHLSRRQTGHDLDLNGYHSEAITLGGDALWVNEWPARRWNDDELAVASLLTAMMRLADDERPGPYPLIEAVADTLIGWAIEAAAKADRPIQVAVPS